MSLLALMENVFHWRGSAITGTTVTMTRTKFSAMVRRVRYNVAKRASLVEHVIIMVITRELFRKMEH